MAISDEDIYVGYRRPELVKGTDLSDPDADLPEDIKWRLFLARQLAMARYREIWG